MGDPHVRHQALPGREEQRRHRPDRERRAPGHAPPVPAHAVQSDDQVLVVRPREKAPLHRAQGPAQVGRCGGAAALTHLPLNDWELNTEGGSVSWPRRVSLD